MKTDWHEQIQRYVNGQALPEEIAALQAAMIQEAELRDLYLEYMNLDVALAAAAEAAAFTESGINDTAEFSYSRARPAAHPWRWIAAAATAACVALAVIKMLPRHSNPSPARPDIAAVCSRMQQDIDRLPGQPPSVLPHWSSPTDSMLNQPPTLKLEFPS